MSSTAFCKIDGAGSAGREKKGGEHIETSKKKRKRVRSDTDRVRHLTQQLGDKLEQAMEELRHHPVKVKVREKQLEYDLESSKLVREELRERESTEVQEGDIDVDNLRKLASAIKDWSLLHPDSTAEQREARLQELLRELGSCETP